MVYLISSCTNAKTIPSSSNLLIRNQNMSSIKETSLLWNKIISSDNIKKVPARKLYQGPSWKTSLDVEHNFSNKFETQLLVASAGHGLISANEPICTYGSTFAKKQLDSVANFQYIKNPTQEWWKLINKFSIEEFDPESYIFIFLPYDYLIALKNFIEEIIDVFDKKVFIIKAFKHKLSKKIEDRSLQFDTRFNSHEKGVLITLVQRCMRWLSNEITLKNLPLEHKVLQKEINIFLQKHSPYINQKRQILNDDILKQTIIKQIQSSTIKSATHGLKFLRQSGLACEQKRYGKVFHTIMNERN